MNPPHRRKVIRRQEDVDARRRVIYAFLAVLLVAASAISVTGFFAAENRKRANEGREAHEALCIVRTNLKLRINRTEKFLRLNPEPVIFGFDRTEIERNLREDKSTLSALDLALTCVPPPMPSQPPAIPTVSTTIGGAP